MTEPSCGAGIEAHSYIEPEGIAPIEGATKGIDICVEASSQTDWITR